MKNALRYKHKKRVIKWNIYVRLNRSFASATNFFFLQSTRAYDKNAHKKATVITTKAYVPKVLWFHIEISFFIAIIVIAIRFATIRIVENNITFKTWTKTAISIKRNVVSAVCEKNIEFDFCKPKATTLNCLLTSVMYVFLFLFEEDVNFYFRLKVETLSSKTNKNSECDFKLILL